ncbi:MAG: phospho-sugar mutase [Defluviitaleaceae bacterium]|nr:phospho-sugar mutase [Defluviitaleaceae bacterium]
MEHLKIYQQWLTNPALGEKSRTELLSIADNDTEIAERFHKDLEFGTGGLRGIIGIGTNRMNIYTVRRASQGLADYIIAVAPNEKERGVAVSHDNRHFSKEFALEVALIMAQNGIKAYLFEDLRPTPQLSFAIRELGCIAGAMVTASHNPPDYNGYKAYWQDGGQLVFPQDEEVIEYVNAINDPASLRVMDKEAAIQAGLLEYLGKDMDDKFLAAVGALSLNPEIIAKMAADFKIVYTPLHGTGKMPVQRALQNAGFKNVYIEPSQAEPDPNFTTVKSPNPEDPTAFEYALKLAKEKNADIIIANDPDADRVGCMVKNANDEYELISGNATGVILAEYLLSQMSKKGILPQNAGIISTIVSTRLTQKIADHYGVSYAETFTGFKHIAKQILTWEQASSVKFIFGFEESFGYLTGDNARDKDAIGAALLLCEAAAFYKVQGKTLFDALEDIHIRQGYHAEYTRSITLPGIEGAAKIKQIIADLRNNPPKALAGTEIIEIRDYIANAPSYDMLYYILSDQSWFCVRPSGTEPKVKIYLGANDTTAEAAQNRLNTISAAVFDFMKI